MPSMVSSAVAELGAADAAVVGADHLEGLGQRREEGRVPVLAGRGVAVDQQQRRPLAQLRQASRRPSTSISPTGPALIGANLLRAGGSTSSISVTGPSLTRATPMQAPKTPFFAPSRSQKRSYSGSATSGRAAST